MLTTSCVVAVTPADPDLSCRSLCNLTEPSHCDRLSCKSPWVPPTALVSESVESGLANSTKATFEYGLANALAATRAVEWTVRQFGVRLHRMISTICKLNQSSLDDGLLAAFEGGSVHNAGFVGPDATRIAQALLTGNIREVFGLVYILAENQWLTHTLLEGLGPRKWSDDTLVAMGLVPKAVRSRYFLVSSTLELAPDLQYNGVPTFLFASFDSWVRFDYAGPDETAHPPQWQPARVARKPSCNEISWYSNSSWVEPPLSEAELQYQCGERPSCKLRWYPGALCWNLTNLPFSQSRAGTVPGYGPRAAAQGWRIVAGPSGTTATTLQLGRLLGLDPRLVRLVMAAWMIRTGDHSLFEIMLGADPFMPHKDWSLNYTIADFGALMPDDIEQRDEYTGESIVFRRDEVWGAVVQDWLLSSADGQLVFDELSPSQSSYILSLLQPQ